MEIPFITGMTTGASLIVAIGAQNTFVLTQGIRKQHRFVVALICSLCDAFLISAGVAGLGSLIEQSPTLLRLAGGGGALFLFIYGLKCLFSALQAEQELGETESNPTSRRQVILTILAITLCNPNVYLDTVVLLGGISATFVGQGRYLFGAGAISMSFIWFFILSYGSGVLAPLFKKAITWRILNFLIFLVMWNIAFKLLAFSGIIDIIRAYLG
ncbi:lysine efflux permease [Sphaerochaeta pleomorpha str. Grapes]|uniref:Lysine efflux permease n=1 Tax=Sphaerochaeta pleomorpha (strain ATCC BAA-1885 / DSM 22778 / Grapes) TaxID=158190 RepID=G8QX72_SPHPG|nr:LysE/ArgO family amino acid transporter [Sphaerochaeta pleomorpha]AEV30657.1 lysine efflux permease [Sphaerochaeta pleomorpha str. Grapes]